MALYEIKTSEGDDGSVYPVKLLWPPCADDAADHGFIARRGLYVAGIGAPNEDSLYPSAFLLPIPSMPSAELTGGRLLRHRTRIRTAQCEWDQPWRMVWASAAELGTVPISVMRHPASTATAAGPPTPMKARPRPRRPDARFSSSLASDGVLGAGLLRFWIRIRQLRFSLAVGC
ncbi:hypothetical protein LE181_25675 [Streptomyces sp. SCA3-4]|uniref:hypothetical protein n=1 Tax=Streptomyces sichuanensis TaxID=2871810 RepID=UPI001CE2B75E|nr:hypothetical protein [Streptomyces sichuanensis]MCA6095542.1 hypothetical protein [Streptomyces sichuanensis]